MRLLIINPNTSPSTTARIARAAEAVAQPGDVFVTRSAAFGPELIVTDEDGAEAARGVLAAVRDHAERPDGPDGPDGIVLASFGDTGAPEVRAARPGLPVIGIAQAAFAAVRQIGGRFSIVTFAPEVAPPLGQMAARHGAAAALIEVATLPGPLHGDPAEMAESFAAPLADLCRRCAQAGAGSIILGGGPLAGLAAQIAPHCPVPLIDGTQEAIAQMRARLAAMQQEAATADETE